MTDITDRLRAWCRDFEGMPLPRSATPAEGLTCDVLLDAADEILKLRATNAELTRILADAMDEKAMRMLRDQGRNKDADREI